MGCVFITGCSSGIGLETALAFARRGDAVVAGMRRPDRSAELAERVAALGHDAASVEVVSVDVTDEDSIRAAVDQAQVDHGAIDVLVNNAGVGGLGSIEDTSAETYRQIFETNVFGLLAMTRAVLGPMRAAGAGAIINVGSIQGVVPVPFFGAYCGSKHAVEAITESLYYEVAPFGIRVAIVEPGRIETAFASNLVHEKGIRSDYGPLAKKWHTGWTAIPGRDSPATAVEVADAIVAAATDPSQPRHRPIGADSIALVEARRSMTDTEFETYLRGLTGY